MSTDDFYSGLLTAIALNRKDAAPRPTPVRSNGKILKHAGSFSPDTYSSRAIRLVILMASHDKKTLKAFSSAGIPLYGDILMFHPALIRGDPLYWVRRKDFTIMASVNEAFISMDPDKRIMKPTMSGHVTVFCRDDVWAVRMDMAHVKGFGRFDVEKPMKPDFFVNPKVESAGYIAVLVEKRPHDTFISLTGHHTPDEMKSTTSLVHLDAGPHLVRRFGLRKGMLTSGNAIGSKPGGTNYKFSVNPTSIPCTFECQRRSGTKYESPSNYIHSTIMTTGGLNQFLSGVLEVKTN
jgi:hypothetical protein